MPAHDVRLIAFYLPQFHPIPENDEWWGKGFTEWTNVSRAKPLFRGHRQPRIPADLGFYDLRLPEARAAQAELAGAHGIEGFCYWHYWFHGQRLLERPFNEVLASGEPDFPFCLAWANESWSRRWLGEDRDILMRQTYSAADDVNHVRWLMNAFADPRHLRVRGRPLFLVYRPRDLPDPKRTTDTFRDQCVKAGLPEPFLLGFDAHCADAPDCRQFGFDGTVRFEPHLGVLPEVFIDDSPTLSRWRRNWKLGVRSATLKVYDYSQARRLMTDRPGDYPHYPCVFVGWDNTPRRGRNAIVLINSSPEAFGTALGDTMRSLSGPAREDGLVFINAWNEWAEGNYLEPDNLHGLGHLQAIKKITAARARLIQTC